MVFRPKLSLTLACIPALVLLLWLGHWQMDRLHWKTALIAQMQAGWQAQPEPLADLMAKGAVAPWTKVRITGHFLNTPMRRWYGPHDGMAGYKYLQAFVLENGSVILVNRGFAPEHVAIAPAGTEPTQLPGLARHPQSRPMFGLKNDKAANVWLWVNPSEMAPKTLPADLHFDPDFFVDLIAPATGNEAAQWPRPTGKLPVLPNNHLDYALTWYGLALVLVVIYLLWHWREKRLRF